MISGSKVRCLWMEISERLLGDGVCQETGFVYVMNSVYPRGMVAGVLPVEDLWLISVSNDSVLS